MARRLIPADARRSPRRCRLLAEAVIQRLDAARQKWWFFSLLTTTVLAVVRSRWHVAWSFMLADCLLKLLGTAACGRHVRRLAA